MWPHPSTHLNSGLIFIHIGTLILSFQTLGFWPYFYTHWNFDLILRNKGILALSLHTFKFWSYRSNVGIMVLFVNIGFLILSFKKPWDSGPVSLNIAIMMFSLRTLDFLPYFYRNSDLILPNIGIRILTFQAIQSGPSSIRIGLMILFFQTLEFWSCFYTHWNFDLMLRNIEFWAYSYKHLGISCPRPSTAVIGTVALSLQTF